MKELLLRKYMIPISITKNTASRISTFDQNNIAFGKIYTDHMFVCDYEDGTWKNARIQPFEAFQLNPATSALHYGQAIFEGMKAFSNEKGEISLFRPRDNARRLNVSVTFCGGGGTTIPSLVFNLFIINLFCELL